MEAYLKLVSQKSLETLECKKNLLAFSSGVDSTALFFLLKEAGICFDIAIVDYGVRDESKDEVKHAKSLATKYNKEIYLHEAKLKSSNFEKNARDERYNFFEKIIKEKSYDNLITAHQLNDRLEWFLMQLTRGAGLVEILGFEEVSQRDGYRLIRPLINSDKKELLHYLQTFDIKYFVDESNFDKKYQRNKIREEFSNSLIDEYKDGIKKSFLYLNQDREMLSVDNLVYSYLDLKVLENSFDYLRSIDKVLKQMGYLLSSAQREEIEKEDDLVIGGKIAIGKSDKFIFIAPFCEVIMPKEFKERCRVSKIPPKIRSYLYREGVDPAYLLANFLSRRS